MEDYKRKRSNDGDRYQLEEALARELLTTYQVTQRKVLTGERMAWIEKRYGMGSVKRIRDHMVRLQTLETEHQSERTSSE